MSALFARVVKQALITFERANYSAFKLNFNALKQLVDQLTIKDLEISTEILNFQSPNAAPVKYIEIFEHKTFTMSVFVMQNKYTMPMHDHPGHGLLRVLSGTARIQSYTIDDNPSMVNSIQQRILSAYEEPCIELTTNNECAVLTPTKCNLHEITAAGRVPIAFFDILSPPYESNISIYGPKKCLFYRRLPMNSSSDESSSSDLTENGDNHTIAVQNAKRKAYLQEIRVPNHYYCDNIYYDPPEFLTNLNFLNSIHEEDM